MEKKPGLVDYHLHTVRCGHAQGRLEEYAATAVSLGLAEIGFSDHFPMLHMEDPSLSMGMEELPDYVREVEELRLGFPELEIRLGIEVDFIPETVERLPALLAAFPFDYIMGSIHFVDGFGFDDSRNLDGYVGRDLFALWERYFDLLGEAAESGLFDVLAHPDLIKKFGFRPDVDVRRLYEDCLDRVAATDLAMEVNTGGLRKPVKEIYPDEGFLFLCRERDIPVTLGSDAHHPSEVAEGFEEALLLLRNVGYEGLVGFKGRERSFLQIPE
jgi:histidinol-phosphatase (PHP family)